MIHEPIMKLPTNIITFSKLALVDDDYDDIYFQYSLESPPLQSTRTESTSPCNNNMRFRGGNKMMDQSLLLNVMMSNHELNYDDAACSTTVCNSSLDDDESSTTSDVSSYLTSMEMSSCHDDTTPTCSSAEEENEDDMSYLCQQLSHSSSYYTALSSEQTQEVDGDEGGDQHPDSSKTLLPSLELVQRIDELLSKERYADYSITNYFEQQQNDDEISDDEEDDDDEYSAPIDYECRVKMMDWSYRVLSYRFPYNDQHDNNERSSSHHIHQGSRRRKHSIQAIQIVSQSFSLVDRYATHYYNNNNNQRRSRRKVMDRNEYKLICMICLHIAAKTSGYFGLYNERGDEFYDDQTLYEDDDTSNCNTASSDYASLSESESAHIHPPIHHRHHQGMRTENEDDSCCYYLSSQESTFSSLSLSSSVSDDDNDCDTTGCNSQSNDGATDQTIVKSTPDTLSCSSNNSSANDRSTRTTHHPANNTKSSSVAISKQQHKSHKRQRRRPSLSLLSLPGLVLLSANEYTIEQLTSIELHVLQTLQWKGIGGTSSTSCTVLNWLWLLLDVIKDAAIGEEDILINNIRECSLINAESVMEDTLCEKRTPCSLFAMASIIHALNEEGYCCNMKDTLAGSYRRVLFDILPHKEKEVDHVIQLYFFGS